MFKGAGPYAKFMVAFCAALIGVENKSSCTLATSKGKLQ